MKHKAPMMVHPILERANSEERARGCRRASGHRADLTKTCFLRQRGLFRAELQHCWDSDENPKVP